MSCFKSVSFFRSAGVGHNEKADIENKIKRNYAVYLKINQMLNSKDPKVKINMFTKFVQHAPEIFYTSIFALGYGVRSIYKLNLFLVFSFGTFFGYKAKKISQTMYMNEISCFLNTNFQLLDSDFQKALTENDFRFVAKYIPQKLTLAEMKHKMDWRFNII